MKMRSKDDKIENVKKRIRVKVGSKGDMRE